MFEYWNLDIGNYLVIGTSLLIIKITPENPILWTGMKGVSAKGRKKPNQMLKRVQHDKSVWFSVFVIPNQVLNLIQDLTISGSRFGF